MEFLAQQQDFTGMLRLTQLNNKTHDLALHTEFMTQWLQTADILNQLSFHICIFKPYVLCKLT